MTKMKKTTAICALFVFVSTVLFPAASSGLTVMEEEQLAREYLKILSAQMEIVEDPLIVNYVNSLGQKLVRAFPQQPFNYQFYVVQQEVYNAFAIPGGHIFIYTGLIAAMDSEEELAGILSHEISHVYCRHIAQKIEKSKKINMATLAGVAAGILLGAAGGGEVASAVTLGSMAAGQSAALANSRADEIQADQVGLEYLTAAGYSGEGLLTILNKIRAKNWFGADVVPSYLMTHPAVEDRLAYIDTYIDKHPRKKGSTASESSDQFTVIQARVMGLYSDEKVALNTFKARIEDNPDDPIGYYGYGLALARTGDHQKAVDTLKKALAFNAFDPYVLTALGRVYFTSGQYEQALSTLQSALSIDPQNPEGIYYLGRTQLELGNPRQAAEHFETLAKKGFRGEQLQYFLAKSYGDQGNLGDAHYHMGLYHLKRRDLRKAHAQLARALDETQKQERREEIEKLLKQIDEQLAAQKKQQNRG
jgi:predicted Zn-dependent protease